MRSAEAHIAALVALIAGAICHHSLESLVRAPTAVMVATAAILAVALLKSRVTTEGRHEIDRYKRSVFTALVVGFIAGCTLPSSAPASFRPVLTHAALHPARDDLFDALDALDARPGMMLGRHIWVTGVWRPHDGDNLATVSQRVMACCAADAVDIGFDVLQAHRIIALAPGTRVRVGGIISEILRQGETRYVLRDADVKALSEGSSGVR